jgi:membrane protease YdiL (CAAX protease family)
MKNRRVFYHVEGRIGKLPLMDEPKDSLPRQLEQISPPPAQPPVLPSAGSGLELTKSSPFEDAVQKIFLGRDGLRPIWRLVLYFLMFRALRFCLFIVLAYGMPDALFLWRQLAAELGLAIIAIAPVLLMSRVEGRAFGCYGLPVSNAFGKLFWVGASWGVISLTLLLLALRAAHAFYFGPLALHGVRVLKFAVFWAAFFLIVGFYEEFFTRGYTQFTLGETVGFWPAAILLSLGFGALHLENPGENWVGILGAMVIGFFFCLTLRRTGNLWFAIGFHASWDWGESYLYSVPDSGGMAPGHLLHSSLQGPRWLTGGSVGPEGSVFLFVLMILLWVVFDRVYPEVKYPAVDSPRTT